MPVLAAHLREGLGCRLELTGDPTEEMATVRSLSD